MEKISTSSGVYCIRNLYTKDAYIGSAHNLRARWNLHKTNLRAGKHHSTILQRAWNKYGADAFDFFVLTYCDKKEVLKEEQFWLDQMTAKYNASRVAGSRAGMKNSKEHNAAISAKAVARWADPDFKARMSAVLKKATRKKKPPCALDKLITAFGKTMRLQDWANETGVRRETISYRLKSGYSPEAALSKVKLKRGPRREP